MTIDSGMSAGSSLNVPIQWSDQDHDLQYHTLARLPIDVPVFALDLNPSNTHIRPREAVTWTLTARNLGPAAAASTAITAVLPFGRDLVSGTLRASVGAATELSGTIGWLGTIPAGQAITLTYQMTGGIQPIDRVDYASAILSDGRDLWHVGNWLTVTPFKAYLPVLRKNS